MPKEILSTAVAAQHTDSDEPFVRMCVATDQVPGYVIRSAKGKKPWQAVDPTGLPKLRKLAALRRAQRATGKKPAGE
jgi:hypothetical protein